MAERGTQAAGRWWSQQRPPASTELCDDFDLTNDRFVECSNVFRRNPVLQVILSTCLVHLIAVQKLLGDDETRDVSLAAGWYVPITSNLDRIGLTSTLDKRLAVLPTGAERSAFRMPDQVEFVGPDGAP